MALDANFALPDPDGCGIGGMSQGRSMNDVAMLGPRGAWSEAQRRVRAQIGLSCVGSGTLDADWAGHAAGTPFLVLRADCAWERQQARQLLSDIAGLTDLAWDCGWTGHRLRGGEIVSEIRIFPGQVPVPVGSV